MLDGSMLKSSRVTKKKPGCNYCGKFIDGDIAQLNHHLAHKSDHARPYHYQSRDPK